MPVVDLPYSLGILLEQLQSKGTMSSWQIFQEKSGSVCVKLRFDCSADQSTMDNSEPVSYKKKSKKQSDRDMRRAQVFNRNGVTTRSKSGTIGEVEIPRKNWHHETMSDMGSPACSTPSQVEVTHSVNHDSSGLTHLSSPGDPHAPDVNKNSVDQHNESSDSVTTSGDSCDDNVLFPDGQYSQNMIADDPGNEYVTLPKVVIPLDDKSNDSVIQPDAQCTDNVVSSDDQQKSNVHVPNNPWSENEYHLCDICKLDCGMCWRRCNHIDHSVPYNICNRCYHEGHTHDDHANQLNMYFPPWSD